MSELVEKLAGMTVPLAVEMPEYARFWELYVRDLIGIESRDVESIMVNIGGELEKLAKDKLPPSEWLKELSRTLSLTTSRELSRPQAAQQALSPPASAQ